MAAKVNVKFVVILSAVLLLLAGGVGFLGVTVLLKSAEDNVRRGDELYAQGEYLEAAKAYGKAVNKETYNAAYLRKWLDAVEHSIPETDVEYRSMYRDQYLGALRQLAVVESSNPQTQADLLEALFRQYKLSGTSAEGWGAFAESVTNSLDGLDMTQPEAQRLLRFRGLASVFRFRTLETVNQIERARAEDDLVKALAADPTDIEAELGRLELMTASAMELFRSGRGQEAAARWNEADAAVNRLVQRFPNSPRVLLRRALMNAERDVQLATNQSDEEPIAEALRADLTRALNAAASAPDEVIDEQFVSQLSRAISVAGSRDLRERWLDVLEALRERLPEDPNLLLEQGKALAALGNHEEAIQRYETVATMPDVPVSLDGLILRQLRTEARRLQVESGLALWNAAEGADRDAAMARVRGFRDALAARVPADSPALLRAESQIAFAERRLDDAVTSLTALRNATNGDDSEVLVMLGRALAAQQKYGAAAEQFRRVYDRDPRNLVALLALIDLELNSGNRAVARELLEEAKRLAPDDPIVQRTDQFFNISQQGVASEDDPVMRVLNASLTLRTRPVPDYAQAISLVEQAMLEHSNDVRLALERVTLASQAEGREAAAAQVQRMLQRFPDDPRLNQFAVISQYDDPVEAQLAAIEQSDAPDLRKHLARASLFFQNNRPEQGDAELAKARAIAPDDPNLVELEFARALERQEYTDAQRLAQRAASLDLDGVSGQLYQARLELAQGKFDSAAATLDRVTREDEWNVPAWRFLGSAQLAAGRIDDALRAFDRALKIKPDDMPTVNAYINALVSVRRGPEALALARRASQLATADAGVRSARLQLEEDLGDSRYAISERMRMRSVDPTNRANNLALAQLFIRVGRLAEAEEILQAASETGTPDLAAALIEARLRAAQGRLDDAVARMEREIQRLPEERRGDGYVVLADLLIEYQRPDDAVAILERARGSQSEGMPVDRKLGDLAFSVGDFERAITSYKAVVEGGGDSNAVVAKRLAEAQIRIGRLDQAEQTLTSIEADDGEDSQTLLLRSQIAQDRQNMLEARRLLDRAIEIDPRNHLAFIRRAQLGFSDDSQFAAVLRDLRQAAQLQPDNITVRQMLSQLFIRRGRVNEAIDELAQAVRSRPENDALRYE
ncbi:MAG: tetratricopeptide repeat protein [Phycisphaerales bacterium]